MGRKIANKEELLYRLHTETLRKTDKSCQNRQSSSVVHLTIRCSISSFRVEESLLFVVFDDRFRVDRAFGICRLAVLYDVFRQIFHLVIQRERPTFIGGIE